MNAFLGQLQTWAKMRAFIGYSLKMTHAHPKLAKLNAWMHLKATHMIPVASPSTPFSNSLPKQSSPFTRSPRVCLRYVTEVTRAQPQVSVTTDLWWTWSPQVGTCIHTNHLHIGWKIHTSGHPKEGYPIEGLCIFVVPQVSGEFTGWFLRIQVPTWSDQVNHRPDLGLCTCHFCDISKANPRRVGERTWLLRQRVWKRSGMRSDRNHVCSFEMCVYIYILYQLLPKPINSFHLHNISHFLYIAYTIYLNFIYITYITYISYVPFSSPASSTSTSSTSHASSTSLTESIGARRLQNSYNVICPWVANTGVVAQEMLLRSCFAGVVLQELLHKSCYTGANFQVIYQLLSQLLQNSYFSSSPFFWRQGHPGLVHRKPSAEIVRVGRPKVWWNANCVCSAANLRVWRPKMWWNANLDCPAVTFCGDSACWMCKRVVTCEFVLVTPCLRRSYVSEAQLCGEMRILWGCVAISHEMRAECQKLE